MKVVHLLMGLQPSGLERMLVSAAPYFRAVGVRSTLVSQGAEQPFASELQAAGYSVVCIPPVKTSSGRRAWASVIRHEQPDVIHIHPEQAFAAAILVGHRAAPDARIVRTVHSYFPATGWWGIKRRLQLALSERHVSATVFLNQEMAAHESGYGRSGFVIGNWVDDAFLTSGRSDRPDVDVILVLRDGKAYAAAQQARTRVQDQSLWSALTDEHESEAQRIAALSRSGRLVVFLGAGASMGAGLPSWSDLLAGLAERAGLSEEQRDELRHLEHRDAGRILDQRLTERGGLAAAVAELTNASRCSLVHQLVASLPVSEAVTTNYDTLFETAWSATGADPRVLPWDALADARPWLLKLHGSVTRPASIVLSRDDYLRFEGEGVALAGIVQAMLLTRHMLFVGYSLSDDNFHRLVHQVRTAIGSSSSSRPSSRSGA